jgi:DnaJ family protein B protein 4
MGGFGGFHPRDANDLFAELFRGFGGGGSFRQGSFGGGGGCGAEGFDFFGGGMPFGSMGGELPAGHAVDSAVGRTTQHWLLTVL